MSWNHAISQTHAPTISAKAFCARSQFKLGVQSFRSHLNTEPDEIKRKYRKLLSDNHPDKVHAKKNNVTEEDIKKANEKTFEIKKAYTLIKSHLASSQV